MKDEDSSVIYIAGSREAGGGETAAKLLLRLFLYFFSLFLPLTLTILCKRVKL